MMEKLSPIHAQLMVSYIFQFFMVAAYPMALRRRDIKEGELTIHIDLRHNTDLLRHTGDRVAVRRRGASGTNHCIIQCNRCRTRMTLRNAGLCERDCRDSITSNGSYYALCLIFIGNQQEQSDVRA
jgi:hypothetical protein